MKTFNCTCKDRQILFFESNLCIACNRTVGIDDTFEKVEPYNFNEQKGRFFKDKQANTPYLKCDNHANYNACNGMVNMNTYKPAVNSKEVLCFACRFNEMIPDLSVEAHIPYWRKMETAKRRALYTLKGLSLPLQTMAADPEGGLSFDFITDRDVNDHFATKLEGREPVFTGHNCGHITINLAEADDVARSQTRYAMGEYYRTLLGHFRHELGHYYFDKLIVSSPDKHALCKRYFGDDSLDYQEAIDQHYKEGAPKNWRDEYISEYATMHPFEDWAETWAHYMHIIDTLETAQNFSMTGSTSWKVAENEVEELSLPQDASFFSSQTSIESILDTWINFSVILNSLNRSMGMNDAYPFVLSKAVRTKLAFVHHAIHDRLNNMPQSPQDN